MSERAKHIFLPVLGGIMVLALLLYAGLWQTMIDGYRMYPEYYDPSRYAREYASLLVALAATEAAVIAFYLYLGARFRLEKATTLPLMVLAGMNAALLVWVLMYGQSFPKSIGILFLVLAFSLSTSVVTQTLAAIDKYRQPVAADVAEGIAPAAEITAAEPEAMPAAEVLDAATGRPWVTWLGVAVCIGIYVGITVTGTPLYWSELERWGFLSAERIWGGAYWGLLTSAFVHFEIWHIGFNLYWFWKLGRPLERSMGSLGFLGLVVLASVTGSSYQLAVSDTTGIGLSGVIYALIGYIWVGSLGAPALRQLLSKKDIQILVGWLVWCFVATYAGLANIGNGAHLAGLVVGAAWAGWQLGVRPELARAGLILTTLGAIVPLAWCPWSGAWNEYQGERALGRKDLVTAERYFRAAIGRGQELAHASLAVVLTEQKRGEEAIQEYDQAIKLLPKNADLHYNLGLTFDRLQQREKGMAEYKQALRIDPRHSPSLYNSACGYALRGDKAKALDFLERSFGGDATLRELAKTDKDLDSLRGDPGFNRLMNGAERGL